METREKELMIQGKKYLVEVDLFNNSDKENIIEIYELWKEISEKLNNYNCRRVNFPEISEIIFCIYFECYRTNNIKTEHSSFDCYNPKTQKRIQIKSASSSKELTSFGPKSDGMNYILWTFIMKVIMMEHLKYLYFLMKIYTNI
ncbi:MAG: Bsp6I family type II restriction endonuclease [Methanosphaera sp.]|nr:Bsp6I family type II restriction endonuclease [Methanosphaera sp.]